MAPESANPRAASAGLRYTTLRAELAGKCAALERLAFPRADAQDLLGEDDFLAYARTFPEGVFVALDGPRVVGQGAGILLDFDFSLPQHTLTGITGEHQCAKHDPNGAWYYGTDIAVHPDYRRRGIGARLYALRKELVKRLGKRGIVAGGHIPGYARHKHRMSASEYVFRVSSGELYDSTLSFQLSHGFTTRGLLEGYIRDEATDGWAVLIVWENPEA